MKILILSASTGGGHMKASSALKSYIVNNDKNAVVKIVDTFEYISPILNKTISEGYMYFATKAPGVYRVAYNSTNKVNMLSSFVFYLNNLFSRKLVPLLREFSPDVILSTHPFSTEMVSNLKENGIVDIPIICIMTDYAPHKAWINKNVDAYVVSNDGMVNSMVNMGVNKDLIYPFGIPIESSFYTKKDKEIILKELGLNPEIQTILIMAGSFGVTDILNIYNNIIKIDLDFQLIIITGRNKKLYDAFEKLIDKTNSLKPKIHIKCNSPIKYQREENKITLSPQASIEVTRRPRDKKDTKLLFFTNEVDKYMQTADLIITKPGGLTVSEALACNLPMAIFDAIPGQEEENAEFLIDNNMAVKISKGANCQETIRKLLSNKEELDSMKASCMNFDKSGSTKNIFMLINDLTSNKLEG